MCGGVRCASARSVVSTMAAGGPPVPRTHVAAAVLASFVLGVVLTLQLSPGPGTVQCPPPCDELAAHGHAETRLRSGHSPAPDASVSKASACPACPSCPACPPGDLCKAVTESYLVAMRDSITGELLETPHIKGRPMGAIDLYGGGTLEPMDAEKLHNGQAWPAWGLTMVGTIRLNGIRDAIIDVVTNGVSGGFVETGVWRGGASLYAAAVSLAVGRPDMPIYACDSYQGLPKATDKKRDNDLWSKLTFLEVSLEQVKRAFDMTLLNSDRVHFVKGYFEHTMPVLGASMKYGDIAVLRQDGDMYSSYIDVFFTLYDKLTVGGYLIVDDWSIPEARKAVQDFRTMHGITDDTDKMYFPDPVSAYWKKSANPALDMAWYTKYRKKRGLEPMPPPKA